VSQASDISFQAAGTGICTQDGMALPKQIDASGPVDELLLSLVGPSLLDLIQLQQSQTTSTLASNDVS